MPIGVTSVLCTELHYACSIRNCDEPIAIYAHGRGFIERDGAGLMCRLVSPMGTITLSGPSSVTRIDDYTMMCNATVPANIDPASIDPAALGGATVSQDSSQGSSSQAKPFSVSPSPLLGWPDPCR